MVLLIATMNMYSKILTVTYAALSLAAGARGADSPSETPKAESMQYLPASFYAAVYVVGGVARGLSCGDSVAACNRAVAAADGAGALEDIGPTFPIVGVGFDYYALPWMAAEIKILQTIGAPRETVYRFDAGKWPPGDPSVRSAAIVDDRVSVSMQNIDAKIGLRLEPFAAWIISPYITPAIGINSTLIKTREQCGDATLQKWYNGPVIGNTFTQHYSFDWAIAMGIAVNFNENLYAAAEGYYDRPFVRHYFGTEKYDTRTTAAYAGVGWRFQ